MRAEVGLVLRRIARDQIALHPRDIELVDALDLGDDALADRQLNLRDIFLVGDYEIAAKLVRAVVNQVRLAIDVAHEARELAVLRLVLRDQVLAEIGVEYPVHHDNGRLHIHARNAVGPGQGGNVCDHLGNVAAVLAEREDAGDAQAWINHDPLADKAGLTLISRPGAIEARDGVVGIPEEAIAGQDAGEPRLLFIGRINADAKEARVKVVEQIAPRHDCGKRSATGRVHGRAHEAQDQIAPRRRLELVTRVSAGALNKARGGFAGHEVGKSRQSSARIPVGGPGRQRSIPGGDASGGRLTLRRAEHSPVPFRPSFQMPQRHHGPFSSVEDGER